MPSELKITDIVFPIFKLRGLDHIHTDNNVVYIKSYTGTYIIDNKNLLGDSLGKRRLRIPKIDLYPLNVCINNIKGLIQLNVGTQKYIDYNGNIFEYTKKKYYKLIYRPITKYRKVDGVGVVIYVREIITPFTIPYETDLLDKFAGILKLNTGYMLYEITNERKKDTRRKV